MSLPRLTILLVAHTADAPSRHPGVQMPLALANSLAARGHTLLLASCKPVCRVLYPLYRLGRWLYETSLPPGVTPRPRRGVRPLATRYEIHPAVRLLPYVFSDRNRAIQRLRRTICGLAPDVCVCGLAGGEQLVWAITLLGSGVPFVHVELPVVDATAAQEAAEQHMIALHGADRIALCGGAAMERLPQALHDRVRVLPLPQDTTSTAGDDARDFAASWEAALGEAATAKGHTVMDAFREEPFASTARLFAVSRREWLWREFGQPLPNSLEGWLLRQPWAAPLRKFALFSGFALALLGNLAQTFPPGCACT